jgi:hypothetical protein
MAARKQANKDANMVSPRHVVVVTGLLPPVTSMLSHNREFAYIAFWRSMVPAHSQRRAAARGPAK